MIDTLCFDQTIAQQRFNELNGLGCACQGNGMGAVSDYDQIKIGGKTYSVNQIVDKTLIAATDTKLYSNAKGSGTVVGTVKAGQPIGIVYSYLRPEQTDGRSWLMFEKSYNNFFFVPNEAASSGSLKEQGTLTVSEEIKKEQDELLRKTDPVGYYLKKYGLPVLLIGGGIYLAATYGKEFIKGKLSQPKAALAMAGIKRRKKKK